MRIVTDPSVQQPNPARLGPRVEEVAEPHDKRAVGRRVCQDGTIKVVAKIGSVEHSCCQSVDSQSNAPLSRCGGEDQLEKGQRADSVSPENAQAKLSARSDSRSHSAADMSSRTVKISFIYQLGPVPVRPGFLRAYDGGMPSASAEALRRGHVRLNVEHSSDAV